MPSKYSLHKLNAIFPDFFTAAPSTNVSISFSSVNLLFLIEISIDAAPDGSTPIIFVLGDNCLNTEIKPETKPPPPIGINI